MPGGLNEVTQQVSADASKYVSEYRAALAVTKELAAANRELAQAQAALRSAGGGGGAGASGAVADVAKINAMIREHQAALAAASGAVSGFGSAHVAAAAQVGSHTTVIRSHTGSLGEMSSATRTVSDETSHLTGEIARQADASLRAAAAHKANQAAMVLITEHLKQTASGRGPSVISMITGETGTGTRPLDSARESIRGLASDVRDLESATRAANTERARLAGGASSSPGPAGGAGGMSLQDIGKTMEQQARDAGYQSFRDMGISMWGPPGGGGGGRSGGSSIPGSGGNGGPAFLNGPINTAWNSLSPGQQAAYINAGLGGGRGGGGGGGSSIPGGGGGGPSGGGGSSIPGGGGGRMTAASAFNPLRGGGFQAAEFWVSLGGEVASTVVPALIAAGSAAAVGAKGFEQMATQGKAIYTVTQSLGPAFNQTFGSVITGSKGPGPFAQAQQAAQGMTYEMAGAGINLITSGAGGGLAQEGTSTLAMMDRGMANMVLNYNNGGAARLAAAAGGGTDFLRQFGDVGANVGNTILNLAPNMPGIGSDLLSGLAGGTGLAATASRDLPGWLLGGAFAADAGRRWGKGIVSGDNLFGRMLGLGKVGGIGGLLGQAGAKTGIGALGDIGEGLAGLGGPELAGLGAAGYGLYKFATVKPSADSQMSGLQDQIDKAGFTQAWQPLTHAIVVASAGAAQDSVKQEMTQVSAVGAFGAGGGAWVTNKGLTDSAYASQNISSLGSLIGSGPQLISALQGGQHPLSNVSMDQAYQIAQMAGLDLSHSFGKNGQLNATAVQQLQDYGAGIRPMTQSGGAFGTAIAAQNVMSQSAMQNLSKVNQSLDSLTTIMESGPLGFSGLSQTAQGLAPNAMAKALGSFTGKDSASAWAAFASTSPSQPGIITQMQQQADEYRTALTLGALNPNQAAGLTANMLKQFLPAVKNDPAALAMLMQQGAQMGVGGYYDPTKSAAQNFQAEQNAAKIGYNDQQANTVLSQSITGTGGKGGHPGLANIPALARQFLGNLDPALQSQMVTDAAQQTLNVRNSALGGGKPNMGAANSLLADLKAQNLSGGALKTSFDSILKQAGISQTMRVKIEGQITWDKASTNPKVTPAMDAHQIHQALQEAEKAGKPVTLTVNADNSRAIAALNGIPKNQKATVNVQAAGVAQAQAAINAVKGKNVTINVDEVFTVTNNVVDVHGKASPYTPTGAVNNLLPAAFTKPQMNHLGGIIHAAGGFKVPGTGSGDIVPAMLEPGEAVVPRYLVPMIAPILARYRVPGFSAPAGMSSHFASGGIAGGGQSVAQIQAEINTAYKTLDTLTKGSAASKAFWKNTLDPLYAALDAAKAAKSSPSGSAAGIGGSGGGPSLGWTLTGHEGQLPLPASVQSVINQLLAEVNKAGIGKQFAVALTGQFTSSIKNLPSTTQSMANALVNKITTEMGYANNVANAAQQGQGFGTAGLISNMNVTPGTGNGSVFEQMQSYLQSEKSFTTDIAGLRKGGLNKDLIGQMVAAGPVQGDALAQSVMGTYGGIKGVNQLYTQIGAASRALGAQATMAQYGGKVSPDLKSMTVTNNNVSISVSTSNEQGLNLSQAQIKGLVEEVQAKLLQQARRNPRTGIQAKGKGA